MKAPSGELMFWGAILLGGGVYIAAALPTTAVEFQFVSGALALCLIVVAVLLLVRYRWSPELLAVVFVFILGWGVVHGVVEGFTRNRVGLSLAAVVALFGYPSLRREVRGQS